MFNKLYIIIILFVFHFGSLFGQNLIKDFTKSLWQGEGMLMGVPATFKMDWKLVLNNQFLELRFSSIRKDEKGNEIVFEAIGLYKLSEAKSLTGSWFDSRGVTLPLKGEIHNNQLIINWGSKKTEQGRTVYTLINNNNIMVKDYVLKNNDYQVFGEVNYISKE